MDWHEVYERASAANGWLLPKLVERYGDKQGRAEFERLMVEAISIAHSGLSSY